MADYFDAASASNDKVKAALLASIAQNGSQAKAAFDQAQQQIQAQKLQAVAAAVAEAAQRGAPQAVQDQTTGTVSSGYDRRLADLSSAQASREGSLASISAQGGTYLDEANAAIPGLRARQTMANTTAASSLANRLASLKAQQDMATQTQNRQATEFEQTLADRKAQREYQAEQQRLQRQYDIDKAKQDAQDRADRQTQQERVDDLQLQIAQANLAKAQTGAQTKDDKAAVKQHEKDAAAGLVAPATTREIASLGKVATALSKPGQIAAGANYALPGSGAPAVSADAAKPVKSNTNPDLGPTQVSSAAIKAVSNTRAYKDAVAAAKAARAAGLTAEDLNAQMQAGMVKDYGHDFPQTRDVVVRMFQAGQV